MVESKIVESKVNGKEINWNDNNLVIGDNSGCIILTSTDCNSEIFIGTVIDSGNSNYRVGLVSKFLKNTVKLIEEPITVTLKNK